jgi:hypothetical protein
MVGERMVRWNTRTELYLNAMIAARIKQINEVSAYRKKTEGYANVLGAKLGGHEGWSKRSSGFI